MYSRRKQKGFHVRLCRSLRSINVFAALLLLLAAKANLVVAEPPNVQRASRIVAAPKSLSATNVGDGIRVRLSWRDRSKNETGFQLERQGRLKNGRYSSARRRVFRANTSKYTDAPRRGSFRYRLKAVIGNRSSQFTRFVSVTVKKVTKTPTPTPRPTVPQDPGGWTILSPGANTQTIYVSSSLGDDSNDGTSEGSPVQTIDKAKSLLTSGHPVWLLLKAGDTWTESIGKWKWPGTSAIQASLLGSYGTGPRPLLKTGTDDGIQFFGGGDVPATIDNVAIIGIDFYSNARDPSSPDFIAGGSSANGAFLLRGGQNILIEDCSFRFYSGNVVIQGVDNPFYNLTIRRNEILNAYSSDDQAHSQGIYMDTTHGVLIEENVIDHNGWNASVAGGVPTIFNHNLYLQTSNSGVVVQNNISANASSHGIMQRSGGLTSGNLLINDPISISSGNSYAIASEATQITNNVVLDGTTTIMEGSEAIAWGIVVDPTNSSTLVQGNLISHDVCPGTNVTGIEVDGHNNTVNANVINNWRGGIVDHAGGAVIGSGQLSPSGLPDPTRSLATYMASLGQTASDDAFLAKARLQSKFTWNPAYTANAANAYVRSGFGLP
jgi:hypothetical protein